MHVPRLIADEKSTGTLVKPVSSAVRILRLLAVNGGAHSATVVARALKINMSTCFNILRTMVADNILLFDSNSKTYSIGLNVITLAGRALSQDGKAAVVRPFLQELADRHNVAVMMWSTLGDERVMLRSIAHSPADLQIQMRIGQRLPKYIGAYGRILANDLKIDRNDLRRDFRKLKWDVPPPFEAYWADVLKVSEVGWACDDGNFALGITSLAVPIRDDTGAAAQALVVAMFKHQHSSANFMNIIEDMKVMAAKLQYEAGILSTD